MSESPVPRLADSARCPCLSGNTYGECCGPVHRGAAAPTAERLMRSRYSAFAIGDADYLLQSWASATRPDELDLDPEIRWFRLDIIDTVRGGPLDRDGIVEFEARFRDAEGAHTLRERSNFVREGSHWRYVDGIHS